MTVGRIVDKDLSRIICWILGLPPSSSQVEIFTECRHAGSLEGLVQGVLMGYGARLY